MMSTEELENKAGKTLCETNAYRVPVPIQIVAQHLNLTLEALALGKVSRVLVVSDEQGAIGYNSVFTRCSMRPNSTTQLRAEILLQGHSLAKPVYAQPLRIQTIAGRAHVIACAGLHLAPERRATQCFDQGLNGRVIELHSTYHQVVGLLCQRNELQG